VGTVAAAGVARFHVPTRTWSPLESGTNGPVYAVAAIDDEIYAGGSFSSAGAARVANVGQWKRTAWSSMGSDPSIGINDTVFALAIRDRNVYVGGRFRTSGGIRTNGIAVWNGERWLPVGGGVSGAAATVRALAFDSSGALYAGGSFLAAGGDSAAHVARWDGSRWSSLGSGIAGPPQRSTTVNAIAIDDDGVHVGGVFSTAGGVPAANVARWNPATSQWSALGAGVRGGSPYATVNALAIHAGRLVAAGRFDSAGAVGATSVAAWDGSAWQAMGAVTLEGRALATRGADLVLATGGLERITIPPASSFLRSSHYLYRWNGSAWTTLDSGGGVIYSLAFDRNGDIYAGGWFSALGTVESNGIAHFVGGRWQPLGSGLIGVDHMNEFTIGSAFAIGATGDDLYVGGNFIIAGRKPSYYFAHWNRAISAAPETSTLPLHDFDVRMHVMPNPVDRGATLRIDAASGVATVRLFDMLGRERMRVAGDGGSRVVEIVLDDPIDAGAYIVRVETAEGVGTGRIVVR
jgi:hypothetical protein